MQVPDSKQHAPSSKDHRDATMLSVHGDLDGGDVKASSPSSRRVRSKSPHSQSSQEESRTTRSSSSGRVRARSRSPFRFFNREREPSFLDPDVFDGGSDQDQERIHDSHTSEIPAGGDASLDDPTIATSQSSNSAGTPAEVTPFSHEQSLADELGFQPTDVDIEQGYSAKGSSSNTGGHIFMNNSTAPAESQSAAHVTNARGNFPSHAGTSYDQDGSVDNSSIMTTVAVLFCRVTIVILVCAFFGIFLPGIIYQARK